jgi:hypothetical protein
MGGQRLREVTEAEVSKVGRKARRILGISPNKYTRLNFLRFTTIGKLSIQSVADTALDRGLAQLEGGDLTIFDKDGNVLAQFTKDQWGNLQIESARRITPKERHRESVARSYKKKSIIVE